MDRDDQILAFIQGRLSEDERAAFEATFRTDPDLFAEITALQAARAEFALSDQNLDASAGWARLETAIKSEHPQAANTNRPMRFSLLQTGGLIAASLVLWNVAVAPMISTDRGPGFETVSEAAQGPVLQVLFTASADIDAITALLQEVNGTLIGGPSAVGLYRVSFKDDAARDAAKTAFEARAAVVDMVTVE